MSKFALFGGVRPYRVKADNIIFQELQQKEAYQDKNFENVYTYRRIIIGYALNRNKFTELYQTVNAVESVISNSNCNNEIISISKKEIKCFLEVYLPPVPIGFGVKKNDKIKIDPGQFIWQDFTFAKKALHFD